VIRARPRSARVAFEIAPPNTYAPDADDRSGTIGKGLSQWSGSNGQQLVRDPRSRSFAPSFTQVFFYVGDGCADAIGADDQVLHR